MSGRLPEEAGKESTSSFLNWATKDDLGGMQRLVDGAVIQEVCVCGGKERLAKSHEFSHAPL